QRFRQDSGGRRFAHPSGAGEQIGVGHALGGNRIAEGLRNVFLSDHLTKRLRPKSSREDRVFHRKLAEIWMREQRSVARPSRIKNGCTRQPEIATVSRGGGKLSPQAHGRRLLKAASVKT